MEKVIECTDILNMVRGYYKNTAFEELTLQKLFGNLDFLDDKGENFIRVCVLDSYYTTHLSLDRAHPYITTALFENREGIRALKDCDLFSCNSQKLDEASKLYHTILEREHRTRKKQWSHVSKFLHFCNPNLFPIHDSRAEKAWKTIKNFEWEHYKELLEFYRKIWMEDLSKDQSGFLKGLKTIGEEVNLKITALTALDKYFYMLV